MNKILSRLFVFFVAIPLVILIVCLPYFNHLALHVLICAITFIAATELYDIYKINHPLLSKKLIVGCSVFIPVIGMIYAVLPAVTGKSFPVGQEIITYALIVDFLLLLFSEVITAKTFETSNTRIASSVFIVLYSGYIITFISRMTVIEIGGNNITTPLVSVFLLMVFMCDSLAWLFGVLLGKNNRGVVKASPNKSVMGFIGGFAGSIAAGVLGYILWPNIFHGSILKIIFMGICIAFSSIVGDLTESIFKRSAGVKDSGHVIPGRGGVLDSIDSILMSAPVFYLMISILYGI